MARQAVLLGVGDVGPIHQIEGSYGALVRDTLLQADIRFAQVERVYSERGHLQLHSGGRHSRVPPAMASIFTECGFNVVSVASNHAMDWGEEALLDTIELLRGQGLQTVGGGRDIAEARQPAILECNGLRVAVLGYCSILREGYAAGHDKPGLAPLRAHTYYEAFDYQPGVPPRVVTVPHEADLANLIEDVRAAKRSCDRVVLSLHWGIHFIPRVIADYQRTVAHAAFDAGADLILGHHAHTPKAIELYDGKACFYSLSNFLMSSPAKTPQAAAEFCAQYGVTLDPDYPHLPYGADAKRSLVAKAVFSKDAPTRASFLPAMIDRRLCPEILRRDDPRFDEIVRFMEWASEGFTHRFVAEGDEVIVSS